MPVYSTVQTGPKTQSGGFQLGFASAAYQVGICGVVTAAPMTAATKQIMPVALGASIHRQAADTCPQWHRGFEPSR
jgi:hypothetical protein